MAWNVLLTGAATLLGLAGIGLAAQEPGFDYQVAAPTDGGATLVNYSYQNQGVVSARFHETRVGEVLDWLDKQGVSYVIADPSLSEHKITLNVDNQPVDDVADAIASALGGHWDRQGRIRVYRSGLAGHRFELYNGQGLMAPKSGQWDIAPMPLLPPDKGGQYRIYDFENNKSKTLATPDVQRLFGKGGAKAPLEMFSFDHRFEFDKFRKSLTDQQKDLLKSQGYLRLDDLTAEQRAMMGVEGQEENLTIVYTKDGQTITIKSK